MRPETGPMEFNGDWRGLFIRGDDCLGRKMYLEGLLPLLDKLPEESKNTLAYILGKQTIENLIKDFSNSHQHSEVKTQKMKSFGECVDKDDHQIP